MDDTHEVISAFLDDEPFDARELAGALSDPGARDLLIDLLVVRHLVQPPNDAVLERPRARSAWRALAAAATVVVSLAGGYAIGQRRAETVPEAPTATRVVEAAPAWQVVPAGGAR